MKIKSEQYLSKTFSFCVGVEVYSILILYLYIIYNNRKKKKKEKENKQNIIIHKKVYIPTTYI